MEFVFGNSGKGYGLLYKSSPRDEQMSKYMQDVNNFGISLGERMYTYKTISDGVSFDVVFSKYSYDDRFERGSIYNHVRWDECKRNDFLKPRFINFITSGFASQKDINLLRETGRLNVANLSLFSGYTPMGVGVPLNTDMAVNAGAPISTDMLKSIVHALHMDFKGKVVVALDLSTLQELDSSDGAIRRCVREIFLRLPVSLRAATSYITSCPLNIFRDSGFRLCVLPLSFLKKQGAYGRDITVIRADETKYSETGELSKYVEWIVNIEQAERDAFFMGYEENVGKTETIAGGRLLEYRKKHIAAKTQKPETKQSSYGINANKPQVRANKETVMSNNRSLPGAVNPQHQGAHEAALSAPVVFSQQRGANVAAQSTPAAPSQPRGAYGAAPAVPSQPRKAHGVASAAPLQPRGAHETAQSTPAAPSQPRGAYGAAPSAPAAPSQQQRAHEAVPAAPPQPDYGRMRFSEASYEGWFLNSRMHGWGVLTYNNGNIYIGEFYIGIIKGWGVMLHPNADWRAGLWAQNGYIRGVCCIDGKIGNNLINKDRYEFEYGYSSEPGSGFGYSFGSGSGSGSRSGSGSGSGSGYGSVSGYGKSRGNKVGPHTQYDLDPDRPNVGMTYYDSGDWYIGEWLNVPARSFSMSVRPFNGWGAYFCRRVGCLNYGRWEYNVLVEQKGTLNIRCIDR